MSIITVRNNHHFSKGVILEIIGKKKLNWIVNGEKLNPKRKTDFIKLLHVVFCFTGCPYGLENDGNMSKQYIINLIYSQPIERNIDFLFEKYEKNTSSLGIIKFENKKVNDAIYKYSPFPNEINEILIKDLGKNYGDVMSLFGSKTIEDGIQYYEYPDSVWLILEYVKNSYRLSKNFPSNEIPKKGIFFYYSR